jgi:hypothetical protein
MTFQEFCAAVASVGIFVVYIPYFWGMYRGHTKPHAFSWVVWALVASIAAAAQLSERAGPGAWTTTIMAVICWLIALVAFKKGEHTVTRGDWVCFIVTLCAIPIWVLTKNPLYSVILVSVIETVGIYPTVRKSWSKPWSETALMYFLSSANQILMIYALTVYTMTTVLYPLTAIGNNMLFGFMLLYRRRVLQPS